MSYAYYTPLTVTGNSSLLPATLTNKDVLVKFTDNRLKTVANGGHVTSSSGYDINFFSDINHLSALTWELFYDGTAGTVVAWVKIPSCALSTVFYMFYGDASITTFQSTAVNVWDSDYKGIWHGGDGTTISLADSTSNANNATNTSVTEGSGKIHGAFVFSGITARTRLTISGITSGTTLTISAWINPAGTGGDTYGAIAQNSAGSQGFFCPIQSQAKLGAYYSSANHFANTAISSSAWTHVALVVTAGAVAFYVNGVAEAATFSSFPSFSIGVLGGGDSSAQNSFAGSIEEFRISTIARSANWLLADYNNQNAPSTFVTLGTEVGTLVSLPITPSDSINNFADATQNSGYARAATAQFDAITLRDAIAIIGGDPFYHIGFSDTLNLQDQIQPFVPRIAKLFTDTINNLADSVVDFIGIPVKAFDSQQFNWDEAVSTRILVVIQEYFADSINNYADLAAAIRRNVPIYVLLTDTINFIADAQRIYDRLTVLAADNFVLSDSTVLKFNHLLKIRESLTAFLDQLGVRVTDRPVFGDTVTLTDLAAVRLATQLSITKTDSVSLTDHVVTATTGDYVEPGFIDRIRRYLGDTN